MGIHSFEELVATLPDRDELDLLQTTLSNEAPSMKARDRIANLHRQMEILSTHIRIVENRFGPWAFRSDSQDRMLTGLALQAGRIGNLLYCEYIGLHDQHSARYLFALQQATSTTFEQMFPFTREPRKDSVDTLLVAHIIQALGAMVDFNIPSKRATLEALRIHMTIVLAGLAE